MRNPMMTAVLLAGAVGCLAVGQAWATDRYWTNNVSGNWDDAGSWTGGAEPVSSDNAYLDYGPPYAVTVNSAGNAANNLVVGGSSIGASGGHTGILNVAAGAVLNVGTATYIGYVGHGYANFTGGAFTSATVYVGHGQNGATLGVVTNNGGTISTTGSSLFDVGLWGTGIYVQVSGTLNANYQMMIGHKGGGSGSVAIQAGKVNIGKDGNSISVFLGQGSTISDATLTMSGGTMAMTGGIQMRGTGGNHLLDFAGGATTISLWLLTFDSTAHNIKVRNNASVDIQGATGAGHGVSLGYQASASNTWTQTGGQVTISNTLAIGGSTSSYNPTSTYHLAAGTLLAKNLLVQTYGKNMFNFPARSTGILYLKTSSGNASDYTSVTNYILTGKICLDGVAQSTISPFVVTQLVSGAYAGYTQVSLKPTTGGMVVFFR